MGAIQAIFLVLKSLPEIIGLVKKLGEMIEKNQIEKLSRELEEATNQLERAHNIKDQLEALKKYQQTIGNK